MSETLGDILSGALGRMEPKAFAPFESGKPKLERPTLEQVASKVVDIVQTWDHSRNEPHFVRHASDGPLQLSPEGVEKFKGLIAVGGDNVGTQVFEDVTELFIKDMMADRPGIGEGWREALTEAKLKEGRFTFDKDTVRELMREEDQLEVETRAGEGWQVRDWAVKFAEQGFDVSGQSVEDQVYFEGIRLALHEMDYRDEMGRMNEMHEKSVMNGMEFKQFDPFESDKPKDNDPTLAQVVGKVVDVTLAWDESRSDPDFHRHASDGPLRLTPEGVGHFKEFIETHAGRSAQDVFPEITALFVADMLHDDDRIDANDKWRQTAAENAIENGTFTYDPHAVQDLRSKISEHSVRKMGRQHWDMDSWAEQFAKDGHDVSPMQFGDQIYSEALRLGAEEIVERGEIGRLVANHEAILISQSGGVSCPSCGGLNTSCPDGCGRDARTGELNGTRLEQDKPALGSITYVGEGLAARDEDFRRAYMLPGEEVRLNPKMDISYVDMGALEKQFGDEVLKVEETRLTLTENAWIKPEYKFEGHEGYHTAQAFEHPKGIIHEFGIMAERDDKLYFVPLKDLDGEAKGPAREVIGLEGRYAEHTLPQGLDAFKAEVKAEPNSGEIAFIPTERGSDTGPVMIAGVPWMSGVSSKELEVANKAIDQVLAAERKPNGLLQQPEQLRGSDPRAGSREEGARALRGLSQGPSDGLPQMPSRSMER